MSAGATTYAAVIWARAERDPDSEVLRTVDGTRWTARTLRDIAASWAQDLAPTVGRGDVVVTCVDAGPDAVALTAAVSALGGVELPLASDIPLEWARHLVLVSGARLVVSSTGRARDPLPATLAHATGHPLELVDGPSSLPREGTGGSIAPVTLADTDPAVIVSTSGTTGRAKAALLPAGAAMAQGRRVSAAMAYGPDDVLVSFFPWHHVNARHASVLPALISGARVVMAPHFSASGFLELLRKEHVTAFNFMGAVCMMLLNQPPSPRDREHSLTKAYGGPAPAALVHAFRERFGVVLRQAYACTELGDIATTPMTALRPGAAGRPVDDHEVRIMREDRSEAPAGECGDIVVRPRRPGLAVLEYISDAEATREAWADDWFRTRDRGRLVDGWLHVEGRTGDVIRRRGLNIDPWHVEDLLRSHPGVGDVAAVAVPSELTEDEVLAVVVPRPGQHLDAAALWAQCLVELPRSLRPRYLSIEAALPYTTHKLDRSALRRRGLPTGCFDSGPHHHPEEPSMIPAPILRVLDLTDELGAHAVRLLVGMGADVLRIRPDSEAAPTGAAALHWYAGTRTMKVPTAELDAAVSELVTDADVVLESGPVGTLRTLDLRKADPGRWDRVAHVLITPFGLTGPRCAWLADDTVAAAAGGMAWLGGRPGNAPTPPPQQQASQLAGTHAAIAGLLAVLARRRTGTGQLAEVSAQEAVAATLETGAIAWIHSGTVPGRTGGIYGHVAHRVFPTTDGFVAGGYSGPDRMWTDLLAWMDGTGEAADLTDEVWKDPVHRWRNRPHVDEVVMAWTSRRTAAEIVVEARRRALPWAEVTDPAQLLDNPQLRARDFPMEIATPDGTFVDVGFPFESPGRPRPVRLSAPQEVDRRARWQVSAPPAPLPARMREAPADAGALAGLRVLDLTWVLAGPYVTRNLADHGADIVKVESAHRQDPTRFAPSMRLCPGAGPDESGYFLNFNRNKRSLALNLRTPQGAEILRRLAAEVDVVVENFSPGTLAKWGLHWDNLRQLNPDCMLVSMAGVGATGPWRTAVTFADTLAAWSGLTHATRGPDGVPEGLTFGLGDMVAANAAVVAVLDRLLRGGGGHVDLSQLEAMSAHLGTGTLDAALPTPRQHDHVGPLVLQARGDDRWLAVGRVRRAELAALSEGSEPVRWLEEYAASIDADEAATHLQLLGVPAYPVRDGRDLVEVDLQLAARHFYPVLTHPLAGEVRVEGAVHHLSKTPPRLQRPAPLLGEHTDEVLTELLAIGPDEIARLREQGVLS